jgi:hypothetical protein
MKILSWLSRSLAVVLDAILFALGPAPKRVPVKVAPRHPRGLR